MGIRGRKTETIRATPVPETTAARLTEFVESNIAKVAKVFTDENRTYCALENHETANHGGGEYARGGGPRQRDGIVLSPGEARVQRDVPPY